MNKPAEVARRGSWTRKLILGIVLLVGAGLIVVVLQGLGLLPVSIRRELKGEFKITYRTYDAFGHRGTSKTIHRRRALWDRLVSSEVVSFVIYDKEPSRVIYQICPAMESPACGTYYCDARLDRTSKIGSYRLSISPLNEPEAWSLNGRYGSYVALTDVNGEAAAIVDLAAGTTLDVGQLLALQSPKRRVRFGPWSPDGKCIVALVSNILDEQLPHINIEEDLFLIDPKERAVEYIASTAPRGWRKEDYEWQPSGPEWVIPIHANWPATAGPEGIRRKAPSELPNLKANPE